MDKIFNNLCFNTENVMEKLKKAHEEGKTSLTGKELIKIIIPRINDIDLTIRQIEKAEHNNEARWDKSFFHYGTDITTAEAVTKISRQTFYRWRRRGIVERDCIKLERVLETLKYIKAIMEG